MSVNPSPRPPLVYETPPAIRAWSRELRREGQAVALVPTMGALHDGHRSLLRAARAAADQVVASIFVNPAQFGPDEDFQRYPRRLQQDLGVCAAEGVDAVYAPTPGTVYAGDHSTWVCEEELAGSMEGSLRPGHFRGVLTIVLKLLHTVEPDLAIFGQKDAQQALLIRRMARDLDLPVVIHLSPTVREADGLALSSRNAYLSPEDRGRAPALYQALTAGCQVLAEGDYRAGNVRAAGMEVLAQAEGIEVEYLEAVDLNTLGTPLRPGHPVLVAGAVKVGRTRLIDNIIHPHGALAALNNGVTSS